MQARIASIGASLVLAACSRQPPQPAPAPPVAETSPPSEPARVTIDAGPTEPVAAPVETDAAADDPMALHHETTFELLSLIPLPPVSDAARAKRDSLLSYLFAPAPGHFNQGNKAIAHHAIGHDACMAGLKDAVIQTDAQRAQCGADTMVPIYSNGDPSSAKACIDVFEFPNRACELPMVWGSPSEAELACEAQGKRLCTQDEWNLSCTADPQGKTKSRYAYGEDLDITLCNTNKPHPFAADGNYWTCNVHDAQSAWRTCETDTEPAGAFPKCRSRLGVYDQAGNVAEIMTRKEGDRVLTQLKGSAFFYVDVMREPGKAAPHPERESYPDTCNYDPRWHVEVLKEALHVNYHLGFRCCKNVVSAAK